MSYNDDPDLWQIGLPKAANTAKAGIVSSSGEAKMEHIEQRRLDLKTIMELLSRAANDLRSAERRAKLAESRAKQADALLADANRRATAAEERAENAEALGRKITTQAARAFETMKERIAQSEAKVHEVQMQIQLLGETSSSTFCNADASAAETGNAGMAHNFNLEERLRTAEMGLGAVRHAIGATEFTHRHPAAQAAFLPSTNDADDARVHH